MYKLPIFILLLLGLFSACTDSSTLTNTTKEQKQDDKAQSNTTTQSSSEKLQIPKPIDLLKKQYPNATISGDTAARYESDQGYVEISYENQLDYKKGEQAFRLILFKNHLYDDAEYTKRVFCRVCNGFISIAKYLQTEKGWEFVDFTEDCQCGNGTYGEVFPPEIVQVSDERAFLKHEYGDMHMGYLFASESYYDVDHQYKRLFGFTAESSNSGALPEAGEEFDYSSSSKFIEEGEQLFFEVQYKGTGKDSETGRSWASNPKDRYLVQQDTFVLVK